jgi:hypothetical protein
MTSDFSTQLKAFHVKLKAHAEKVTGEVVIEIGATLVDKSPWGRWEQWSPRSKHARPMPPYVPGLFKGSWDYDFDAAPSAQLDTVDQTGATSMARIYTAHTTPAFVRHFIVNNTEYAEALEYGYARHNMPNPTPPGGMVRTTMVEFPSIVAQVLARGPV